MTIASRIEERFKELKDKDGIKRSWSRMATDLGFTPQASTRWKKDVVSNDTLQEIAGYLDTNLTWLLTGEGSPERFNIPKMIEQGRQSLSRAEEREKEEQNRYSNINKVHHFVGRRIPIISYIEAGSFGTIYELDSTTEYIISYNEELSEETFALIVQGYSMSPDFNPGDTIIVDKKVKPSPGDCVIAQNGDHEATFKKYKPRGYTETGAEVFDLEPINPDYPILKSNVQSIRIIGTVLEQHKKLRRR